MRVFECRSWPRPVIVAAGATMGGLWCVVMMLLIGNTIANIRYHDESIASLAILLRSRLALPGVAVIGISSVITSLFARRVGAWLGVVVSLLLACLGSLAIISKVVFAGIYQKPSFGLSFLFGLLVLQILFTVLLFFDAPGLNDAISRDKE